MPRVRQAKQHHGQTVLGMPTMNSLRSGDKFYVLAAGEPTGHCQTVATVKRGPTVTVLCMNGGSHTFPFNCAPSVMLVGE